MKVANGKGGTGSFNGADFLAFADTPIRFPARMASPRDHRGSRDEQSGVSRRWAKQERQRRHTRTIQITDEAIRKFRPNTWIRKGS
jgi:hypothetical protein